MPVHRILAGVVTALALLVGCGPAVPAPRTPDPLAGNYILRGGGGALDTVTALTKAFTAVHPGVIFQGLEDVGSDAAIRLAASGEADLGFISRDLRPAEVGTVNTQSIGRSGTALAVNAASVVRGLTKDQVIGIYTGAIADWTDLGGASGKIRVLAREPGSAVRSGFESYFFGSTKPTYTKSLVILNDASQTIDAIGSFKDTIGMLSMSAQAYGASSIRMIAIDGVPATKATVADGTYKILRNLYLVYSPDPAKVKPAMKEFLRFVQSDAGQEIIAGL
jgi:phosphate transport system substrate-binding protein